MKKWFGCSLIMSAFMVPSAQSFEVAIDPVPFLLKGYSLHFAQTLGNQRFDIGVFKLEAGDEIHGNDNFDMAFEGVGIKYDYLFNHYEGTFVGWELNVADVTYTHTNSNDVFQRTLVTTAPRLGYRFVTDNKITITPWIALDILLYDGANVESDGDSFENEKVQLFPSVHLGYRF
jgi:hypothetical protein